MKVYDFFYFTFILVSREFKIFLIAFKKIKMCTT